MKTITIDGTEYTLTPVEPPKPARLEFPKFGSNCGYWLNHANEVLREAVCGWGWRMYEAANCFRTEAAARIAAERRLLCMRQVQAGLEADPDAGGFIECVRRWTFFFDADKGEWITVHLSGTANYPIYVHTREQAEAACELLNREGVKP